MKGKRIPETIFNVRVRDDSVGGDNPYKWENISSNDIFSGKTVLMFSLPGAFTPTCSTYQLPDFEKLFDEFKNKGVDEIYCLSVNDSFVMNAWGRSQNLKHVKLIPDGNGEFTRKMGMLVEKKNQTFGLRSWRYAALIDNCVVKEWFQEEGFEDNCEGDPYEFTRPQYILKQI